MFCPFLLLDSFARPLLRLTKLVLPLARGSYNLQLTLLCPPYPAYPYPAYPAIPATLLCSPSSAGLTRAQRLDSVGTTSDRQAGQWNTARRIRTPGRLDGPA